MAFFAAAVFRAVELVDAFAAAFFAGEVFVAAVFLAAAAFFAGVVFRGVELVETFAGALDSLVRLTAGSPAFSFLRPAMMSLNCAPGRNEGTDVARTFTVSPVRGLRATRGARRRFSKTPKPVIVTLSPLLTARTIVSTRVSTAAVAVLRSASRRLVSSSMSWALFIAFLRRKLVQLPDQPNLTLNVLQ